MGLGDLAILYVGRMLLFSPKDSRKLLPPLAGVLFASVNDYKN